MVGTFLLHVGGFLLLMLISGLPLIIIIRCRRRTGRTTLKAKNNYPIEWEKGLENSVYYGMEAFVPRNRKFLHSLKNKQITLRDASYLVRNLDIVVYRVAEYNTYAEFLEKEMLNINPVFRDPKCRKQLLGSQLTDQLIDEIGVVAVHYIAK